MLTPSPRNATGGTLTSITDSTRSWVPNEWVGQWVKIRDGTGSYESRQIVSNTSDTLTVNPAWPVIPDGTSKYVITGQRTLGQFTPVVYNGSSDVHFWGAQINDFYYYRKNYLIAGVSDDLYFKVNNFKAGSMAGWQDMPTLLNQRMLKRGVVGAMSVGNGENHNNARTLDNVRIIPASPDAANKASTDDNYYANYVSGSVSIPSDVLWGTIYGTVRITSNANPASEAVFFQTSTDNGASWDNVSGESITSPQSTSILYKANFQTLDNPTSGVGAPPYYSETVVLEDVYITYLPETQVLYWREVTE
jgi:hypothetical protein